MAQAITAALATKLLEDCYQSRNKNIVQQRLNEQKIWSIIWCKMSPASQSKVQEEAGYEEALLENDCVRFWEFIRRTHLTHIYRAGDPMAHFNVQEQDLRYSALEQDEKEYVSDFKLRFDAQIQANIGAGVPAVSEPKRALEFIYKLDPKRFRRILAHIHNNVLCMHENVYP